MDIRELIDKRRAYRSLEPAAITEDIIEQLSNAAKFSASCFNNQPWRYVFVYKNPQLDKIKEALDPGNAWAKAASMIIAVLSKKELDCQMKDGREYYLFDTGMATGYMLLMAAELGLVAHPIAGYNPAKAAEVLSVPQDMSVVTLVIVGKHSATMNPLMSEKQAASEKERPKRLENSKFVFHNVYKE